MTVIPAWPEIDQFPASLEPGERKVVEAYESLISRLDPSAGPMHVYVQPYLDNYRPDLVVGIPGKGVLIVEVKDWNAGSKIPSVRAESVAHKAAFYRRVLLDLCYPDFSELVSKPRWRKLEQPALEHLERSVASAIICAQMSTDAVRDIFPAGSRAFGADVLEDLSRLPRPSQTNSRQIPPELISELMECFWRTVETWLTPPYHRAEQGSLGKTALTPAQRQHATVRGPGWYRLRGPVGAGKSLVIAHKAAVLASQKKQVLVICFNIALKSYLRDLISRMRYSFSWEHIDIRNFHELLKKIRLHFEVPSERGKIESVHEFLESHYPGLVEKLLIEHSDHPFKYDAVLVDEGQDFPANWFGVLARCLDEEGELLLVRDRNQNVYSKDIRWSDSSSPAIGGLTGTRGFRGPWAELKTTWRMSPTITEAVSEFSRRELGSVSFGVDPQRKDQKSLYPGASFCRWENIDSAERESVLVRTVREITKAHTATHPSDVAVLTFTNEEAWDAVDLLRDAGFEAVHVYDKDGHRDRRKIFRFRKGDGRIKVCTGHSFKGFEVWGAVLCVHPRRDRAGQARWIYTCMGRAVEGLWVLNMDPAFDRVATWFPSEQLGSQAAAVETTDQQ